MSADLRHIDTWLFDLDDTLYGAETGLIAAMEAKIEGYLARTRGLPVDDVADLRRTMRRDHGSTLAALIAEDSDDIDAFLVEVHDVPLDGFGPDRELRTAVERLPGRRLVHTNAPGFHAERILGALGIADLFEGVFHCQAAQFALKPHAGAYTRLIETWGVTPASTCFFEDNERNLEAAHRLGMTTVLVGPHAAASLATFVNHRTDNLTAFLNEARVRKLAA